MVFVTEGALVATVPSKIIVGHTIDRRAQRMKYKIGGVIATMHFFINQDKVDKYQYNLTPRLIGLEGTVVTVPNMQKHLLDYVIH